MLLQVVLESILIAAEQKGCRAQHGAEKSWQKVPLADLL